MAVTRVSAESKPRKAALELMDRMEALSLKGEWQQIDELVSRARNIVPELPEDERLSMLTAMNHCIERVKSKALASRVDIKDKLSDIQRGRVATRAYGQPPAESGKDSNTVLR